MQLTVEIPDEVAHMLAPDGKGLDRATLEAVALEGYRSGRLTASPTRRLLGFESRYELDGFLKAHRVWEHAYSVEYLEQDRLSMQLEADRRQQA